MAKLITSATPFLPLRRTTRTLRNAIETCRGCELYAEATQAVFGRGPQSARLMLVGEQPGNDEDLRGLPFVGPSGRVLDQALQAAGIERSKIYVTNVVKHFRFVPRGKRRIHKPPAQRSIDACMAWLEQEVALVQPHVIVCLGAVAAHALIDKALVVSEQRGVAHRTQWAEHTLATVHPSSIVRTRDVEARHEALALFVADLKCAASLIDAGSAANNTAASDEAKAPDEPSRA